MHDIDDAPRAVVPANINEPDKIAFGLTFRQLAIVGGAGLAGYTTYRLAGHLLPPTAWLLIAAVVGAITVVVALGRRDGLPLDVWLRNGISFTSAPRTLTPGSPQSSALAAVAGETVMPAPLRLPVTAVSQGGAISSEGVDRVVIACGTTNIHLRTGDEQEALLEGFGRFLNSLTGPAQIVVAAQRQDLSGHAEAIAGYASRLPHPALQAAAEDHAAFLLDLAAGRDPLRRQVLTVVTGSHAADAATRALTALGVDAAALDGPAVTAALAGMVDPFSPPVPGPRAAPGTPITMRRNP
ncbi:PrgI family protein [Asanoa hainanensis]|uniref:PrgI family protein n=1 Tax=Asanoa hainanensis TaxID=560556 RepID=A0A239J0S3_9ACTN|nr:PrgI family protein [Asanoa hainanensis]SNS98873.1 PrgI family protein [Asanoa hainanensis]